MILRLLGAEGGNLGVVFFSGDPTAEAATVTAATDAGIRVTTKNTAAASALVDTDSDPLPAIGVGVGALLLGVLIRAISWSPPRGKIATN